MSAVVYRWDALGVDRPMALLERRRVIGEKMMLSQVRLSKGCDVPMHAHANEQITCVLSGSLRFGLQESGGNREVVVCAGDVMLLPSGVPHSAFALEDTLVLDLFSPPSEKTGIDAKQE